MAIKIPLELCKPASECFLIGDPKPKPGLGGCPQGLMEGIPAFGWGEGGLDYETTMVPSKRQTVTADPFSQRCPRTQQDCLPV